MSGHSKWSQIKRKKGVADQQRGKLFAKLLRYVEVAAREGGGSVEGNATLAAAVQKARDASVPVDTIERAIKRGTGELEGARYEEATYEGFAPGGVALLIEVLTDNRNRSSADIRHAMTRFGGSLGDPGSVAWMFERRGVVIVDRAAAPDEERLLEVVSEAGAEDLNDLGDQWEVVTPPQSLRAVREALEAAGIAVASADLTMQPQTLVPVARDQAAGVLRLLEALEDLEDVQAVHANFDIPEEVMAEVG
ncbi:MAG TPA: YebC/PmpR family DNA-binding transcriptional regulator [Actinomycetota bacterium]|nr:YebC/PmpR family DNA-binding transcriptional regulator [Actinomycetota bacterium]